MPQQQSSETSDDGRLLLAAAVFPTLTHLAVGDGAVITFTGGILDKPPKADTELQHEIGRVRYLERSFVVEDDAAGAVGPIGAHRYTKVTEPTNLVYFRFRFLAAEAQGSWDEFALYGAGVTFTQRVVELLDGNQGGDDRANEDVALGGTFALADSQQITVTVVTPGASGVATVSWASTGSLAAGGPAVVTAGVPVVIGASGITLSFGFGLDGVLTGGDQWFLRATAPSATAVFASGGVYNSITNEDGQVKNPGLLFRLYHLDPPLVKGAVSVDAELVTEVLNDE